MLFRSKINLSGGTISAGSLDTNGNTASFNWTGGLLTITGASGFSVNAAGPLGSNLTIGTGVASKTLTVTR